MWSLVSRVFVAVGSWDLPTRDTLELGKMLSFIEKHLVLKCLEMLRDISEMKVGLKQFYEEFRKFLLERSMRMAPIDPTSLTLRVSAAKSGNERIS